ncbi:MAG: DUF1045 domain-containing protein [Mesorhizobium sp.]|uniref:DUF1045 domain-containing protein n=1 Tax=Mesorhizobium sp. TaxID=1871066 RepID=UPI000FE52807|nr:DUF1045 domain-containing protein [Mesorhizobium sp.]RWK47784.1 MAG: DUF1045 domain-containing protein [Mesorhizobium sp.]
MPDLASQRFAIYYTPGRDHPVTEAARQWLGRDAFLPSSRMAAGLAENKLVTEPRRYGFHATLKAPFRLAEGQSVSALEQALHDFADRAMPCPIGRLRLSMIDGFFALVPAGPTAFLRGFASRIVREFDRFRAPMNQAELQRRMRQPLDDTETSHLVSWGYPYVHDRFKFHLTLTDRLPEDIRPAIRERLKSRFEACLDEDLKLETLSLFVQDHPNSDFYVRSQFSLRGDESSGLRWQGGR